MPNEANFLDIILLGKEYRVACPFEERDALLAAAAYVDAKMHEIAEKTKNNMSERIAVMAALIIAHEHLAKKPEAPEVSEASDKNNVETGLDFADLRRRISVMEAELEAVLVPHEKLL